MSALLHTLLLDPSHGKKKVGKIQKEAGLRGQQRLGGTSAVEAQKEADPDDLHCKRREYSFTKTDTQTHICREAQSSASCWAGWTVSLEVCGYQMTCNPSCAPPCAIGRFTHRQKHTGPLNQTLWTNPIAILLRIHLNGFCLFCFFSWKELCFRYYV